MGLHISKILPNRRRNPALFYGRTSCAKHLSIETPLRLTKKLLERYQAGDSEVVALVDNRDIHIIQR